MRDADVPERRQPVDGVRPAERPVSEARDARPGLFRAGSDGRSDGAPDQRSQRGSNGDRPGHHVPGEHDLRRTLRALFHVANRCPPHGDRADSAGLSPRCHGPLGRKIHDRFDRVQENFSRLTTLAQENLAGVRIVRAFRQEDAEVERFRLLNDEYLERNMALTRLYGIMQPSFGIFAGAGMVAVLGVGGALALRGTISIGSFLAFGMYLALLTCPMIPLGWGTNLFQRGPSSLPRLLEVLDAQPSI